MPRLAALLALVPVAAGADTIRVATYNASLTRPEPGALADELARPGAEQPSLVAEVIRRANPDILLLNEFDADPTGRALAGFQINYLAAAGMEPYSHAFVAPSNTGVPTGFDLDGDGATGGPGDAQGFGEFEGRYGFAVLSRFPIAVEDARTFQRLLWRDMPGSLLAEDPALASFYAPEEAAVLRLSSKNHLDLAVEVGDRTLHVLASHPTPPVFDGPEDRNGKRNHDEIRFWADYVAGAGWMVDDAGRAGGLAAGEAFVVLGDLNADPFDGDSFGGAARLLLDHPLVQGSATDPGVTPASDGGAAASARQGGANAGHGGDPRFDTADFGFAGEGEPDAAPGNLRADYVLPSVAGLRIVDAGVAWLTPEAPAWPLGEFPASDHRLVWMDLEVLPE